MKLTKEQRERLIRYLARPYNDAEQGRSDRCKHYDSILRVLHGDADYTKATKPEQARAKAQKDGQITSLPDDLARFGEGQLRNLVNDIAHIVMPVDTPYAAVSTPEHQDRVDALISVCRAYAVQHGHRTAMVNAIYDLLTVQETMLHAVWYTDAQRAPEAGPAGLAFEKPSLYGAFWDTELPLGRCAAEGEIMGFHRRKSRMQIYMDAQRIQDYTLPDEKKTAPITEISVPTDFEPSYRRKDERNTYPEGQISAGELLHAFKDIHMLNSHARLVETVMYVRLPPEVLKVRNVTDLRIYRITMVQGHIVHIEDYAPGISAFPMAACNLYGEEGPGSYRSYGEHACAMTQLLSGFINLHKQGMRREATGDIMVYDSRLFPDEFDLANAAESGTRAVKANVAGLGNAEADLRSSVFRVSGNPAQSRLADIAGVSDLFSSYLFPRSGKADVAGLDRATAFHASMAVGLADSTLLAIAILVDDALGAPLRRMLKYQIVNHNGEIRTVDPRKGQFLSMSTSDLASMELEFTPSQPVAGFDRNRSMLAIQTALNIVIQTPQIQENPQIINAMLKSYLELATSGLMDLSHFGIPVSAAPATAEEASALASAPTAPQGPTNV